MGFADDVIDKAKEATGQDVGPIQAAAERLKNYAPDNPTERFVDKVADAIDQAKHPDSK